MSIQKQAQLSWKPESRHHNSDSERISFVDYINKQALLTESINPNSPTHLFEVVSEGVVLNKLIIQLFPGTISEKKLITKTNKSTFEKNINNELTIQAAKDLGCSVVNIGPEDISNGTPHLILGLLWQIIKKGLLKNVTASTEELISELISLQKDEKIEDDMTPEQAVLHWMNYHLRKSNHNRIVSNFSADIADCECYAVLLRRISPDKVQQEDVQQIFVEKDTLKRSEFLIEIAKRVIGEKNSIFVTPNDIINGNPRLNLAFAVTLFNTHPYLEVKDSNTVQDAKSSATKESVKANGIWIIGKDFSLLKPGILSWDTKNGILSVKIDSDEAKLKREDLQVIPVHLWDFGFAIASKSNARLGAMELQERIIYVHDLESPKKEPLLQAFFEACKRYTRNVTVQMNSTVD